VTAHLSETELLDLVSGTIANRKTEIEAHLARCDFCHHRHLQLLQLESDRRVKPPPDLVSRLLDATSKRHKYIIAKLTDSENVKLCHRDGTNLPDSVPPPGFMTLEHPYAFAEISGFFVIVRWIEGEFKLGVSHKENMSAALVVNNETTETLMMPDDPIWFSSTFGNGEVLVELRNAQNEVEHRLTVRFEC